MTEQDISKFIVGILILGITLIIGIFIASTLSDNFITTGTVGAGVNETTTPVSAGVYLDAYYLRGGSCGTITAISNASGDTLIVAGNYTQTGCLLQNLTIEFPDTDSWLVNYPYTYSADTYSSNASDDLADALTGGSAWITILVVIGFAVIVLGMLSEGLGRAAGGRTETPYTY